MDSHVVIRLPRRLIKAAVVLALVAAVISPIAVSASHTFTDVPDNNVFHSEIAWLADTGVTKGCNPPTNDEFCPDDFVTRGQMAAFMQRLAEAKVVDAATAETATSADDADTLEGFEAGSFAMGSPTQGTPILYFGGSDVAITSGTDSVVVPVEVELPDYCGGGNTLHDLLIMGGGTANWTAGRGEGRLGLTVDTTVLSFNGTTRVFSLEANPSIPLDMRYAAVESHYVATDLAPGTHTIRLMGDGFNGTLDFVVRNANLTVVEMGWSCS